MPELDPDATIKARPSVGAGHLVASKARPVSPAALIGGLAGLIVLGGGAYFLFGTTTVDRSKEAPQPAVVVPVPSAPPATARLVLPHRSETDILAQQVAVPTAILFSDNASILVIDYPDLKLQGSAFNRMAAFIEKAGLPRDRVLGDQELSAAILGEGATPETYYYGHDYRIADVARFFATADRQRLELGPEEERLRGLLAGLGKLNQTAAGAIISIPREGSDPFVDASGRMSLLRHELSHGEYFTNPAYAEYCRHFWADVMTETDRAGFRKFLTQQGYDPTDDDLLINETQAHLMHTTDTRYFNARQSGLSRARIDTLRLFFLSKMPASWLHDATAAIVTKLP